MSDTVQTDVKPTHTQEDVSRILEAGSTVIELATRNIHASREVLHDVKPEINTKFRLYQRLMRQFGEGLNGELPDGFALRVSSSYQNFGTAYDREHGL